MAHTTDSNELLEIPGNELRAVIGDDAWGHTGKLLPGSLYDDLHISLFHALTDLPVHDIAAIAVQDRAEVVKRATNVDIADIYMPVRMGFLRLPKALPFAVVFAVPFPKQSGVLEYAIDGTRTDSHDILIEHHESQAAVAVERMGLAVGDNRLLLPRLKPEITRDPAVVFIYHAVALLPVVELAV